jgi:prolyl-tRNA synthetase
VKQETRATIRVIPLDAPPASGPCIRCGQPATAEVYFAQAY